MIADEPIYSITSKITTTVYQLPITNYQLPITNYQLPITNYQLPITSRIAPVGCGASAANRIIDVGQVTRLRGGGSNVQYRSKLGTSSTQITQSHLYHPQITQIFTDDFVSNRRKSADKKILLILKIP